MKVKIFRNKKILTATFAVILIGLAYLVWPNSKVAAPTHNPAPASTSQRTAIFDKNQHSTTDPSSIWVIVNKKHPLTPISYAPSDLVFPSVPLRVPGNESMQVRQVTAQALQQMFAEAKADGLSLKLSSGYRSYAYQAGLYNSYVKADGQSQADDESARPGYSEHQTGLAVDLEPTSRNCELEACFADTPEGKWLYANAYKYGFIRRYTTSDRPVTGYENEAWHFRYIGTALSEEMHRGGITTLEQFFGVSGGNTYSP